MTNEQPMKKLKFDMQVAARLVAGACSDSARQIVSEAAQLFQDGIALQTQLTEARAEITRLRNENAFLTNQISEQDAAPVGEAQPECHSGVCEGVADDNAALNAENALLRQRLSEAQASGAELDFVAKQNWSAAPRTSAWGDGMMVADVAITADETLTMFAHEDAIRGAEGDDDLQALITEAQSKATGTLAQYRYVLQGVGQGRGAELEARAVLLEKTLRELLDSHLSTYPPYEAGKGAQDEWADRRAKACNDAAFVLAAPPASEAQPNDE